MVRSVDHLQPGCPWYSLSEVLPPNIQWCEENLCAWIVNPANTWSNLAYVLAGLWILYCIRFPQSRERTWLGVGAVVVGVGSWIHHAAYNFITQLFDFLGMYYFLVFVVYANFIRWGRMAADRLIFYWALTLIVLVAATVGFYFYDIVFQAVIPVLTLGILIQEWMIHTSKDLLVIPFKAPRLKYFNTALFFLIIAAICSALDAKRIWCFAQNHWFQGHAAWHILSAIGLYFLSIHLLTVKPFMRTKSSSL